MTYTGKKSDAQEALAELYLRLNGYFVTGFIVHTPPPHTSKTDIDLLAIRFPNNSEINPQVKPSKFLHIPDKQIDFIIGEVRGRRRRTLQFNETLRNDEKEIKKVLNWIGAFEKDEIEYLTPKLKTGLNPKEINSPGNFNVILASPDIETQFDYQIRPIIFAPNRTELKDNQIRFVHGKEMMNFIWYRLRPDPQPPECSPKYDYELWKPTLTPIVKYFKDKRRKSVGTIKDLYKYLGV